MVPYEREYLFGLFCALFPNLSSIHAQSTEKFHSALLFLSFKHVHLPRERESEFSGKWYSKVVVVAILPSSKLFAN